MYNILLLFIITEGDSDKDTPMDVDKTVGDEQPSGKFDWCILIVLGLIGTFQCVHIPSESGEFDIALAVGGFIYRGGGFVLVVLNHFVCAAHTNKLFLLPQYF